jgi:transcriptional regulator with XRE-family HTH domain
VEDPELGHQLRALRAAAGRTVAAVAEDAGLSVPYIANLENGRGNPTTAALSRLASALGMRLELTLVPAGDDAPPAPSAAAALPASLARLGRTSRFQRTAQVIADSLDLDPRALTTQLVSALAMVAAALGKEPVEADWWRLLDAILLMATFPAAAAPGRR